MKKNLNILFSIVSLLITAVLLIFNAYGWYISNKEVEANGVIGSTDGDDYTVKLQKGSFNKDSSTWTWTDTNSLSFVNISPGNVFFFRIVINSEVNETKDFNIEFRDIESKLVENILNVKAIEDKEYVGISDNTTFIPFYELDSNKKVTIEKSSVNEANETITESKVLYDCSGNSISLVDFKIQNTFLCYTFESEPTSNVVSGVGQVLTSEFNFSITGNGEKYYYFALEFNDEASLETINEVECSNAYFYQMFSIGSIYIRSLE